MSSSKGKQELKVSVLKGQEAENAVLEYLKRMNRPYGAVDVAANLKGAVPKTAVQKILVALAEKGELVQKIYGKTTFFVYNQAKIECLSPERINELKKELAAIDDQIQASSSEIKSYSAELAKIKATPTNNELTSQIEATKSRILKVNSTLQPLRSGAPPITAEELEFIYADWTKWRAEWIRRRKVFITFWQLATDSLPPQDAQILEEDLGIEKDSAEHVALEQSSLCLPQGNSLKRKRL
ncbi:Homologous-pairing protein 2 [Psilocybe cubensis]|uniref:Homologous-pairing protein 2 n=2 Tax=Psilocybe cubensis TaxID=181762 RepID=A0ACB8HBZ6_PSICU|nr:Homologous-pairing protein 2 [Psilocybe cubensis]KAH9485222.1 Homologous-pairing protein 2 [Psilocybe cubensis]